ncbi:hypothetical protein AB8810_12875 [Xanthomonas sp. NCPPB 3005]|uniref:hypothetical protein n=1 Tax=Xanthomonas sp. NCPPB 3005 TaxID=3240913 RepID=UPI003516C430
MTEELTLAPATGWQLRVVPSMGAVAITLRYLVSPMERVADAHASPNFVFHPWQLRELAHAMLRAADKAENAPPSPSSGPTN